VTEKTTHFGYATVNEQEKAPKVRQVFDSVAANYDMMNDLMSLGLHRVWKAFTVGQAGIRPGMRVLDVAGGTADMALAFAKRGAQTWLTDINGAMLLRGRDRLLDAGLSQPATQCDAEKLPFPDNLFDVVTVAFGLRNMTHKEQALAEMHRVLKPGGKLLVLEFSKVAKPLEPLYDLYSFRWLPWLGAKVARDSESYRYLAESIRMHPDQETLKQMMLDAGFDQVQIYNLSAGVVALHQAYKY
jgi:demethylmenaquinone methyltransferase/2-methoxy-6-polyprenyl-1,4-benzoquinol methylase